MERSYAGRTPPTSFWQGLNRNKHLKKLQSMPEAVAVYHRKGWQELLRNIWSRRQTEYLTFIQSAKLMDLIFYEIVGFCIITFIDD